ncbi:uncharacterized protein [Rutidosis leptorrhynchoides]|uniref:uncharacterized protein n=1 Tax=Rutidosis leptorrhynchoides TaxID=125765 RepID=UPI003A9A63FA
MNNKKMNCDDVYSSNGENKSYPLQFRHQNHCVPAKHGLKDTNQIPSEQFVNIHPQVPNPSDLPKHELPHTYHIFPSLFESVRKLADININGTSKALDENVACNPNKETQMQRMGNQQQAMQTGHAAYHNATGRPAGKQVLMFALLLHVIEPQLDKDRAMQLQGLYARLRNNNINREEFVRHMRTLVGDHMLKMAVLKLQYGQLEVVKLPSPSVGSSIAKRPKSAYNMPFSMLFEAVSNKVAPNDMKLLRTFYESFRANKMLREDFIKKLRSVVGDQLLRSTLSVPQNKAGFVMVQNGQVLVPADLPRKKSVVERSVRAKPVDRQLMEVQTNLTKYGNQFTALRRSQQ